MLGCDDQSSDGTKYPEGSLISEMRHSIFIHCLNHVPGPPNRFQEKAIVLSRNDQTQEAAINSTEQKEWMVSQIHSWNQLIPKNYECDPRFRKVGRRFCEEVWKRKLDDDFQTARYKS